MTRTFVLALAACIGTSAQGADLELGEYLAADCTSCHSASGAANGIPGIAGWPAPILVTVLEQYRDGERDHAVMRTVARSLSEEEMQAVAAWLEQQPPQQN